MSKKENARPEVKSKPGKVSELRKLNGMIAELPDSVNRKELISEADLILEALRRANAMLR